MVQIFECRWIRVPSINNSRMAKLDLLLIISGRECKCYSKSSQTRSLTSRRAWKSILRWNLIRSGCCFDSLLVWEIIAWRNCRSQWRTYCLCRLAFNWHFCQEQDPCPFIPWWSRWLSATTKFNKNLWHTETERNKFYNGGRKRLGPFYFQ